jgi:lipid II:glycine glycyltransferase (peptidoglycan interpeptide bridge formation enzyme)
MHKKTRYNIRLAEKKELIIKNEKNVDIFYELYRKTQKRDNFNGFSKEYLVNFLNLPFCNQLTVYNGEIPIASVLNIFYNNVLTYVHGASDEKYQNLMGAYLLQLKNIEFGKKTGAKFYDFWGVEEEDKNGEEFNGFFYKKNSKLSGVSRFKFGFGGERFFRGFCYELPNLKLLYTIFRLTNYLRKICKI